ncbi:hypothetical protein LVD15_05880 [Fulvivirga maritima]|uniref:serine O-acetyltransferase n=1 Tax=Fulvivirga maritima TaxID=2904247 RepID=UPI001F2E92DE|nr:DapH/DapD/GlmU-related protein [Fulvivirga maritima]UII27950.1 hypothetical protein LVD15_05880 [Fulvivirga maritima]
MKIIKDDLIFYGGKSISKRIGVWMFHTGFQLLALYRVMYFVNTTKIRRLNLVLGYFQKVIFSSEISASAQLGARIKFPHPFGVVIGENVKVGNNVTIFQQVTMGSHGKKSSEKSYPTIGNNCIIYSGAKIIGGVHLGENVNVGANSVVLEDVPENCVAVGVPSKVIYPK